MKCCFYEIVGGWKMKILGSFIDCIYESELYEQDMREIRNKLVNRLPDKRICDLASVLIIDTKYDMYAVKIRMCDTKEDGSIDVENIHKKIMDSDFIEITKEDYHNLISSKSEVDINDWRNITRKTNELIAPGSNVIFKMDIDVDSLL